MYDLTVKLAPCGAKPEEYLRRRTGDGLEKIFGGNVPEFARERLENELEFIRRHCYGKYFCGLDYINSAVSRTPGAPRFAIVGAGCEFFVAYLLGITPVNPLKPYYRCPRCGKVTEAGDAGFAEDLPDVECECGGVPVKEGHDICFHEFRKLVGFFTDDQDSAAKILRDLDVDAKPRRLNERRGRPVFMRVNVYTVSPRLLRLFLITGRTGFPGGIKKETLEKVYASDVFTSPEKLELLGAAAEKTRTFGDLVFLISASLIHDNAGVPLIKRFVEGEKTDGFICTREDYRREHGVTPANYVLHIKEIMKLPSKLIAVGLAASISTEQYFSDFDILSAEPEKIELYTEILTADELLELAGMYDSEDIYDALFDRFDELGEEDGKTLAEMARERFDKVIVDGWLESAGLSDGE